MKGGLCLDGRNPGNYPIFWNIQTSVRYECALFPPGSILDDWCWNTSCRCWLWTQQRNVSSGKKNPVKLRTWEDLVLNLCRPMMVFRRLHVGSSWCFQALVVLTQWLRSADKREHDFAKFTTSFGSIGPSRGVKNVHHAHPKYVRT